MITTHQILNIDRLDIDVQAENNKQIYNLEILQKYKFNNKQKNEILIAIKKAILCTNLSIRWKSIHIKTFLSLLNILSIFICSICVSFSDSGYTFQKIRKTIIINLCIVPIWIFSYIFYFKLSDELIKIQRNLGNYLLKVQSQFNNYYDCFLNKCFSLIITDKSLLTKINQEDKLTPKININNVLISYAVCANIEPSVEEITYNNYMSEMETQIIRDIINFAEKDINHKLSVLFKNSLIPAFLIGLHYYIKHKESAYFTYIFPIIVILLLIAIILIEGENIKIFRKKFAEFLEEYNSKLIESGKYVYRYKTLLIIMNLNSKGKKCSKEILERYIESIIYYKNVNTY